MQKKSRKIDIKVTLVLLLIYYTLLGGLFFLSFYNFRNKRESDVRELKKIEAVTQMYSSVFSDLFFTNDLLNRYEKSKNTLNKNFYSKKISEIYQYSQYSLDSVRLVVKSDKEVSFLRQVYFSFRKIQALTNQIINTSEVINQKIKQENLSLQFFKLRKIDIQIRSFYNKQIQINNNNLKKGGKLFLVLIIIFALSLLVTVFIIFTISSKIKGSILEIEKSFIDFLKGKSFQVEGQKRLTEFDGIATKIAKVEDYFKLIKESIVNLSHNNYSVTAIDDKKDYLSLEIVKLRHNLIDKQKKIENQQIEASQRDWINSGLAKFNEILRLHSGQINELSTQLITALVKYLGTIQGGVFIVSNDDETQLELTASYAFNRQKYLHKTVSFGEGLVGTAAIESRTIYLTELPPDYLEITSGLGETKPVALLIVPLKRENKIFGVFELSSFNTLEKYQIEFVEKVAELAALTINTEKINQKTVKLLGESQRKSDELATQEEEMRQNLEELRATQEEAKRKEKKILNIIDSINNGFGRIILNTKKEIIEANRILLSRLNMAVSAIASLEFGDVIEPENDELENLWEEALAKKTRTFYFHFIGISDLFIGTLIPIFNVDSNELTEIYLFVNNVNDLREDLLNIETEIEVLKDKIKKLQNKDKALIVDLEEQKQALENVFDDWKEHLLVGNNYKQENIKLNLYIAKLKEAELKSKQKIRKFNGNEPDDKYKDWLDNL